MHHAAGNAAQEQTLNAAPALMPHHDEIGIEGLRRFSREIIPAFADSDAAKAAE